MTALRWHVLIEDGEITGTMRSAETLRLGADSYACASPDVTFAAG